MLTWFEKMTTIDAYRVNGHYAPYAVLARDVRFTDAELAAETWMAWGDVSAWETPDLVAQAEVFERFATHPHFDQL